MPAGERRAKCAGNLTVMAQKPVACTLGGPDLGTRRERWQRLSDRSLVGQAPTARGLTLRFRTDAGVEDELGKLVELERECCGFAEWRVRPVQGAHALELTVEADGDGATAIRQMFRS